MGIRNFLYTRFLDLLSVQAEVVAWHVLPEHVLATQKGRPVRFESLPYVREGLAARLLRQGCLGAQGSAQDCKASEEGDDPHWPILFQCPPALPFYDKWRNSTPLAEAICRRDG